MTTPFNSPIPLEQTTNPFLIPPEQLKSKPYFNVGSLDGVEEEVYFALFDPAVIDSAADSELRNHLLATFVPAKQLAAGGVNRLAGMPDSGLEKRSFEMQADFGNGGWYDEARYTTTPDDYWDHGDFKKAAMPYVWGLYEKFVELGELR